MIYNDILRNAKSLTPYGKSGKWFALINGQVVTSEFKSKKAVTKWIKVMVKASDSIGSEMEDLIQVRQAEKMERIERNKSRKRKSMNSIFNQDTRGCC